MLTWGLMFSFIPFDWNAVFKCQDLWVELLLTSEKVDKSLQFSKVGNVWQNTFYLLYTLIIIFV